MSLFDAVLTNDIELISRIINAIPNDLLKYINIQDSNALHEAIIFPEIAKLLINSGADINIQNKYGDTPLYLALHYRYPLQISELLINAGADVNIPDKQGTTPLHEASSRGPINMVKKLINNGANVNIQNEYGTTPLHKAAMHGQLEIVKLLLEHGPKNYNDFFVY